MEREEILNKIKELQPSYLPGWNPDTKDSGWAVAEVFANIMGELYAQFDKVPDKLFVAYLDKLGYTQNPPLPAFVPVTFTLSDNCKKGVVVPKLTELESKSKVSFETIESFTVTSAKLTTFVDIYENRYVTDHSDALTDVQTMPLFSTKQSNNYLYFGDDYLFNIHKNVNTNVGLTFTVPKIEEGVWEYYGKLEKEGEPKWIRFKAESSTRLNKRSPYTSIKKEENGISTYWIRVKTDEEYVNDVFTINFQSRSNIDALFHNTTPLNQGSSFYPFGYRPQINDLLYIASGEAFSKKGFEVEVLFDKVSGEGNSRFSNNYFAWEYWNGESWKSLKTNPFKVPEDMSMTAVNGEENYWVRVRVLNNSVFGTYEDEYAKKPYVSDMTINVKKKDDGIRPQYCFHYKNLEYRKIGTVGEESHDASAFYFGFDTPLEGFISLYIKMAEGSSETERTLRWQCYTDEGWQELNVKDGSNAFAQNGYIQFIAPSGQTSAEIFSKTCYWVRARFDNPVEKRVVASIHLNTIEARQRKTLDPMPLGSSDGSGFQSFTLTDTNVFDFKLWVLENELPEEYEGYEDRFGEGYWVLWNAVNALHGASSIERVYTLNAYLGEVSFGDDRNGKIPPMGRDNIRVSYAVGGGTAGNVLAEEIDSLVDTVAYIDNVINPFDATGGADIQSIEKLMEIAPKRFKHRFRAVTHEDYRYLVQEATSSVAKVSVVESKGAVNLYIVPHSRQKVPKPTAGLKRVVSEYLLSKIPAAMQLNVEEPKYLSVSLDMQIELGDWEYATTVKKSINEALDSFLHPVTGRSHGTGWEFGALPSLADIYKLLNAVEGIDKINTVNIMLSNGKNYSVEKSTIPVLGRDTMICSGVHTIELVYEGGE